MEHIYRGFRISLRQEGEGWQARFWRVNGAALPLKAFSTLAEGDIVCLRRATQAVDLFLDYVGESPR